jgi:MFS family permease
MDYGTMLDESFSYAKEGVWNKWTRWLLLIVSMIIFPLILGYMVRIFRGETPAPEPGQWGSMFIDGLKLFLVELIYAAPVILLFIIAFLPLISSLITTGALYQDFSAMSQAQTQQWILSHPEFISAAGFMMMIFMLAIILAIIITIFSFIGTIRFAATGSMSEAFNFSEILSHIRRIGWVNYILALLVIGIIGFIVGMIINLFSMIPKYGDIVSIIVMLIIYVPFILFSSRYNRRVYEAGLEKS